MSAAQTRIALGIVTHARDVLLIERTNHEPGLHNTVLSRAFPGGKIEPAEEPEETASREVREETGLHVLPLKIITEKEHPTHPVIVSYIGCRLLSSRYLEPQTADPAISDVLWVPINKLDEYLQTPLDETVQIYLQTQR